MLPGREWSVHEECDRQLSLRCTIGHRCTLVVAARMTTHVSDNCTGAILSALLTPRNHRIPTIATLVGGFVGAMGEGLG